jgi:UDP-2,3-diacylglucosamine pyrophosphatase LpxH
MSCSLILFLSLPLLAFCGPLSFTILGDWGLPIDYAKKIAAKADSVNSSFILGIGDNFYSSGVQSVNDKLWKTVFENIYKAPIFQTPWYIIAGNHDHLGNVSAQLAYSKMSARWIFPSLYYTKTISLPDGGDVLFVFIDTCGLVDKNDSNQFAWIETTLSSASSATWVIVVGHYPIYSVGSHGTIPLLVSKLSPLFAKYKVGAYINGHEHGFQYIRANNISYITTGNVAKYSLQGITKAPREAIIDYYFPDSMVHMGGCKVSLKYCLGFTTVSLTAKSLAFTFWDQKQKELYSNVIKNPRAV